MPPHAGSGSAPAVGAHGRPGRGGRGKKRAGSMSIRLNVLHLTASQRRAAPRKWRAVGTGVTVVPPIPEHFHKRHSASCDTGARCLAWIKAPGGWRIQDAGAKDPGFRVREASWTATALHRFSPKTCLPHIFQEAKSLYVLWQRSNRWRKPPQPFFYAGRGLFARA
jgi:hypothetical protein